MIYFSRALCRYHVTGTGGDAVSLSSGVLSIRRVYSLLTHCSLIKNSPPTDTGSINSREASSKVRVRPSPAQGERKYEITTMVWSPLNILPQLESLTWPRVFFLIINKVYLLSVLIILLSLSSCKNFSFNEKIFSEISDGLNFVILKVDGISWANICLNSHHQSIWLFRIRIWDLKNKVIEWTDWLTTCSW